jgi:hypothetical protein
MNQHTEKGPQHGSDKKPHEAGPRPAGPGNDKNADKHPGNQKQTDDRHHMRDGQTTGDRDTTSHGPGR